MIELPEIAELLAESIYHERRVQGRELDDIVINDILPKILAELHQCKARLAELEKRAPSK